MMDESFRLVSAFAIGLALGVFYLGTLWVVVQRLHRSKRPGVLLLSSAVIRIGLLLVAWYWVADGNWERLLACLLGFLILRFAATRWVMAGVKRPVAS